MKILISLVFISSLAFANYNSSEGLGKIDMHGGKGTKLLDKKSDFNSMKLNSLNSLKLKEPAKPNAPKALIEEKKEKNKSTNKKSK